MSLLPLQVRNDMVTSLHRAFTSAELTHHALSWDHSTELLTQTKLEREGRERLIRGFACICSLVFGFGFIYNGALKRIPGLEGSRPYPLSSDYKRTQPGCSQPPMLLTELLFLIYFPLIHDDSV